MLAKINVGTPVPQNIKALQGHRSLSLHDPFTFNPGPLLSGINGLDTWDTILTKTGYQSWIESIRLWNRLWISARLKI